MEAPIHVFIVEDSKIFVRMLEYIFTKDYKYRFLDFKTARDCLDNLNLEPDIVVLDDDLGETDDVTTLQKIKQHKPDTKVVVLMGKGDKYPSDLLASGADDFLLKDDRVIDKVIEKLESFFSVAEADKEPVLNKKKKPSLKKLQFSD